MTTDRTGFRCYELAPPGDQVERKVPPGDCQSILLDNQLPEQKMKLPKLPEVVLEEPAELKESVVEGQLLAELQQVPPAMRRSYDSFTGILHLTMRRYKDDGGSSARASKGAGSSNMRSAARGRYRPC